MSNESHENSFHLTASLSKAGERISSALETKSTFRRPVLDLVHDHEVCRRHPSTPCGLVLNKLSIGVHRLGHLAAQTFNGMDDLGLLVLNPGVVWILIERVHIRWLKLTFSFSI